MELISVLIGVIVALATTLIIVLLRKRNHGVPIIDIKEVEGQDNEIRKWMMNAYDLINAEIQNQMKRYHLDQGKIQRQEATLSRGVQESETPGHFMESYTYKDGQTEKVLCTVMWKPGGFTILINESRQSKRRNERQRSNMEVAK